jgi:hypothetical protein
LSHAIIIGPGVGKDVKGVVAKLGRAILNNFCAAFTYVELLLGEMLEAIVGFKSVYFHQTT